MGIKQIKIGTKDFIGVYINGVKRDFFVGVSKVAEGEAGGGDTPVVPEDTKLIYNAADDTFTIKAGTYKDESSGEDYVLAEDMVLISDGAGTYTNTSGNIYFSPAPMLDSYACAKCDLQNYRHMISKVYASSNHSPMYMTCFDENTTRTYMDSANVYSSSGAYTDITAYYNSVLDAHLTSSTGNPISQNTVPSPYWVDSTSTTKHGPLTKTFAAGEYVKVKYELNPDYAYDANCLYTINFITDYSATTGSNIINYELRSTGEVKSIGTETFGTGYPELIMNGEELSDVSYVEIVYTRVTSSTSDIYFRCGLYKVPMQPASGIYASACWLSVMNFGEEVYYNMGVEAVSEGYDPSTDPRADFQTFLGFINYNFATNKTENITSTLKYDVISPWCEI